MNNGKPRSQGHGYSPTDGLDLKRPIFHRHIMIDHANRMIWIQVMATVNGKSFREDEAQLITAGMYWDYVPKELVQAFREGTASGYRVVPLYLFGMSDDKYVVYELHDKRITPGSGQMKLG